MNSTLALALFTLFVNSVSASSGSGLLLKSYKKQLKETIISIPDPHYQQTEDIISIPDPHYQQTEDIISIPDPHYIAKYDHDDFKVMYYSNDDDLYGNILNFSVKL